MEVTRDRNRRLQAANGCQDNINLISTRAQKRTAMKKEAVNATKRAMALFKVIKAEKWDEVLRHLDYYESDAKQWIEENNEDGSVRWKSLPIHLIFERNPPFEIVRQLIRIYPASLECKNYGEDLPMHIACREGVSKEIIEHMIEKNFETVKICDCEGRLPIHLAAASQSIHVKSIEDIISFYEKGVRTPDDFGLLPLHWACSRKAPALIVETLIKAYPYATELKDSFGRLPIDLAKKSNNSEKAKIMELLSRDPSSWTSAMMSTIVTLSNKLHAAEAMESDFERQLSQIKKLVHKNSRSDNVIKSLHTEFEQLEDHFVEQIRVVKKSYNLDTIKIKNEQDATEKRAVDLKVLIDELVEQLKTQKTLVDGKEASRKELKEKAITLVKHLETETAKVGDLTEENEELKIEKDRLTQELEKRDFDLANMARKYQIGRRTGIDRYLLTDSRGTDQFPNGGFEMKRNLYDKRNPGNIREYCDDESTQSTPLNTSECVKISNNFTFDKEKSAVAFRQYSDADSTVYSTPTNVNTSDCVRIDEDRSLYER